MILTDSEVGSLKAALNWWEWFGYVSTAIVFIGCVGEFIAEFTHLPKSAEIERKLARLSLIVLILGIAGELLSTVRTSQLSGRIIANIEGRAADAEKKAGEANKEAARLAKVAEAERLARVKIEASVAWRRLTDKQKTEIGVSLRRFSNQGVSFWYIAGDVEASGFTADIAEAVSRARTLRVYAPASMMTFQEGGPANLGRPITHMDTGVFVVYTEDAPSLSLANAIARELDVRGFDAVTQKNTASDKRTFAPQVWVNVAARPEGPQGEYKLQAEREAKAKKTDNRTPDSR